MQIAFCYNIKLSKPSLDYSKQRDTEYDSPETIKAIWKTLQSLGHKVIKIEADLNAFEKLKKNKNKIDLVFTIAEGLGGDARESQISLFCEMLGIAYTHSSPTVNAISLNKSIAKTILKGGGVVRVPSSQTITSQVFKFDTRLHFPLIIKPNREGSSKGIMDKNVVGSERQLKRRVGEIFKKNSSELLVEEFIDGREFNVSLLGNPPKTLPTIEQKFDFLPKGMNRIAGYELKWIYEDSLKNLTDAYDCPAKISLKLQKEIEETSKKIYCFLGVRDCARIDYRLDKKGKLYFLEINTLPGINPDEQVISYFPLAARAAGLSFKELVGEILTEACKRYPSLH
jgi:D-alanine-D-alanine ligase